jgi:hypothetical protein
MVNRARIATKHGMAAMFDALLFLTAVSVVAVTTIILSALPTEEADAQVQQLADRTHLVLCRMSVQPLGLDNASDDDPDAPHVMVGTIVVSLFSEAGAKGTLPTWLNSTLAKMLGEILGPRYFYRWMVSDGRSALSLASVGAPQPSDGEVFVSSLEMGGDPPIRSTLSIWPSG